MSFIKLNHISKSYDEDTKVINDISLSIERGEFVTIVGPSGCGKTTLLKMVNKLIEYDSGSIIINGNDVKDWDTIQLRRSIGYVIQQIGLMPHLNIEDNINFVLSITQVNTELKKNRAKELIQLVGLSQDYLLRYPRHLSGGQKQRVGVARALAADPDIILMDEPFGAVDEIARSQLQREFKEIHERLKKTILFVTHDIQEALKLGTKIVLLNKGEIIQVGTKEELVFDPKTEFVKSFFGLKGFQASLNEKVMYDVYNKILDKEETLDNVYCKLGSSKTASTSPTRGDYNE